MWYSRRKNLLKTRVWLIGKRRKSFSVRIKKPLGTYNKRSHLEPIYKLWLKPISLRILDYILKNIFLDLSNLLVLPNSPVLSILSHVPKISTSSNLPYWANKKKIKLEDITQQLLESKLTSR
jgi:hypothetical protein